VVLALTRMNYRHSASVAGTPISQTRGVGNRSILDMINFCPPGTPITTRRALQNVLQNRRVH
jgi:hypothetical protein